MHQVLNVAFLMVGTLCTLVGSAGYYMYGNAVRDVVTFNLPKVRRMPGHLHRTGLLLPPVSATDTALCCLAHPRQGGAARMQV